MATAWRLGPPLAQPHGRAAPRSPAVLASSGSRPPPGSTCTRSWVRRRTQEPKTAPRLVAQPDGSTLSRYSLSSQARGLMPRGSARPSGLRAGCRSPGRGADGPGRARGTWAGDALHQGVHQGLPARPAQGAGCLVVRKEAVGEALLVPQRPVQPATATGHLLTAGEIPLGKQSSDVAPRSAPCQARRLGSPCQNGGLCCTCSREILPAPAGHLSRGGELRPHAQLKPGGPRGGPSPAGHPAAPLPAPQSPSRPVRGRDGVGRSQPTCRRAAADTPGHGRSPGTRREPEQCRRGTSAGTAAP